MEDIPISCPVTKEEQPLKKLSLEIESNTKNRYSIALLGYRSYLEIKINSIDKIPKFYKEKFSLDKLKKISKYFLICDSITDAISSIEPIINQSSIIEEKNILKLIISLNHPLCKEAIFLIPEKIKIFDSNELYHIITKLRNDNQKQQNIINQQQQIIKNLQINVNDLMIRVKTMEEKIQKKEEEEERKQYSDLKDSKIISNDLEKLNLFGFYGVKVLFPLFLAPFLIRRLNNRRDLPPCLLTGPIENLNARIICDNDIAAL